MNLTVLRVTADGQFIEEAPTVADIESAMGLTLPKETEPVQPDTRPYDELTLLSEIRDLLRTLNDNIYSLRLDMQPLCGYYQQILDTAERAAQPGLPIGFPGREQLAAKGITAVADIPRTIRRIEALVGCEDNLAMQIARELAALKGAK